MNPKMNKKDRNRNRDLTERSPEIMKLTKRFLATGLALALIMAPLPALAAPADQANTPKDEVVYVAIDNQGKAESVHVVNAFRPEEDTTILDYGNYESLVNLTNDQAMEQKGDAIRVPAKAGQFFYQGNGPKEEVPWILSFDYKLDGKAISPADLAGKAGEVSLVGHVKPNPKAKTVYTKYYMAQLSLTFDSNKVEVVDGDKAQVAYAGSDQTLTFVALPGEELEFKVQLKAKDFTMGAITMAGIPFSMDMDLPDTDELLSGLSQLESGIQDLNKGTQTLAQKGLGLSDGTKKLYNGMAALQQGAKQASQGQATIIQGQTQLQQGLGQYAGAIGSLVDQLQTLGGNLGDLSKGVGQLESGAQKLDEGMKAFSQGLSAYTVGVGQLAQGQSEFTQGLGGLVNKSQALKKAGDDLLAASQKMVEGLKSFQPEGQMDLSGLTPEKLAGLKENFMTLQSGLNSLQSIMEKMDPTPMMTQLTALEDGMAKLETSLNQEALVAQLELTNEDMANPAVQKLLGSIGKVQSSLGQMKGGLAQGLAAYQEKTQSLQKEVAGLKSQMASMQTAMGQVQTLFENDNIQKLLGAMGQMGEFSQGLQAFHGGLSQYVGGNQALLDALSGQIYPGAQKINEGLSKLGQEGGGLVSGFGNIKSGQDQLIGGIKKFVGEGAGLDLSQMGRIEELKAGIDTILANHNRLLGGQKELATGLTTLSQGLGDALSGMAGYQDGISQYVGGVKQLSDGTGKMADQTKGMSQEAKTQMDEALAKFSQEGFQAESFVSDKNTQIGLVQFVYRSEGIQKEEEVTPPPVQEEKSLWDKFLDLFR